jgi:hypothetical protein
VIVSYFNVRFTDTSHVADGVAEGEIQIDDFVERFESDLAHWNISTYQRQWREAASQVQSEGRAAVVTTFASQSSANFVRCWAMYRAGQQVRVQEKLIFLDELSAPFEGAATSQYLAGWQPRSTEGLPISTWTTSVVAVANFAALRY